jgi:hypothetical protein
MLQVGQTLVFVPSSRRGQPTEVTVTKVGRRWADIEPPYIGRVDIDTLSVDGGNHSSPGRCYLSMEDYETEKATNQAWLDFWRTIDRKHSRPKGVTVEVIHNVVEILGLESEFRQAADGR